MIRATRKQLWLLHMAEVESEMVRIQREHWTATANATQAAKAEMRRLQDEVAELAFSLNNMERAVAENQRQIKVTTEHIEWLRGRWKEVNAEKLVFDYEQNLCPTCGQRIPEERIAKSRDKALADFNLEKAKRLEGY